MAETRGAVTVPQSSSPRLQSCLEDKDSRIRDREKLLMSLYSSRQTRPLNCCAQRDPLFKTMIFKKKDQKDRFTKSKIGES